MITVVYCEVSLHCYGRLFFDDNAVNAWFILCDLAFFNNRDLEFSVLCYNFNFVLMLDFIIYFS